MKGEVILITGSSRGLGAHAAERFSDSGYAVALNYSNSQNEADALADRMRSRNAAAEVIAVKADVSKHEDVVRMFDEVYDAYGKCDILINMAGINRDCSFLEMTDEQWNSVIGTVLTGTFMCGREFARRYSGDSGRIINIGAVTAIKGRKNGANYCSARAGVLNLTRCMALELAPRISVNTVTPGYMGTEEVMTRHSLHIKENYDRAVGMIPEARLGTPEDVFSALEFLVSGSRYMTGQNIMVDGGFLMR